MAVGVGATTEAVGGVEERDRALAGRGLIAGGVARSRSDALAWCVRLVQRHTDDWLTELSESLEHVQRVRAQGPDVEGVADSSTEDSEDG